MKRSKEFILRRNAWDSKDVYLDYSNGIEARIFCYLAWVRAFGIKCKMGGSKRVKITIEEIN